MHGEKTDTMLASCGKYRACELVVRVTNDLQVFAVPAGVINAFIFHSFFLFIKPFWKNKNCRFSVMGSTILFWINPLYQYCPVHSRQNLCPAFCLASHLYFLFCSGRLLKSPLLREIRFSKPTILLGLARTFITGKRSHWIFFSDKVERSHVVTFVIHWMNNRQSASLQALNRGQKHIKWEQKTYAIRLKKTF